MTKLTQPQPILQILWDNPRSTSDAYYAHLKAYVAWIDRDRIRGFQDYGGPADRFYYDLRADCQLDGEHREHCLEPYSYGWEIEYRTHCVNLERSQKMTKTLQAIHKKMTKLEQELGRPKTYGQFVAHFASAIGASTILIARHDQPHGPDEYIHLQPGLAIDAINRKVLELRNKCLEAKGHSAIAQAA